MEEEEVDSASFNSFNNDGSFMERFKKMQEEKKPSEAAPKPGKPILPPLRKAKPLLKKKNPFVKPPRSVKSAEVKKGPGDGNGQTESTKKETASQSNMEQEFNSVVPKACGSTGLSSKGDIPPSPGPSSDAISQATLNSLSTSSSSLSSSPSEASSSTAQVSGKKRKRSRWSDAPPTATPTAAISQVSSALPIGGAMAPNRGQQQLTPEQLEQMREQMEMNKMVAEIKAATAAANQKSKKDPNRPQYEYDSDEDVEGGTWEHKKRAQEMKSTLETAERLTEMNKGKHHIGDFLPPEELEKFIERVSAIKEGRNPDLSDYKDHKLTESNVGFRLLQKAGWTEGQGLGEKEDGIKDPINQGKVSFEQAGVGAEGAGDVKKDDNAFDTYRKRMMLAYRFRPNPLNNPRRPYY